MAGAIDSRLRPSEPKSHLKKLGVKTTKIAPGSVNGGGIYVMDKPAGIEEGSVILPLDSLPYRKFVAMMLVLVLPEGKAPKELEAARQALQHSAEFQALQQQLSTDPQLQQLGERLKARYTTVVADFNKKNAPMKFRNMSSLDDQLEYLLRDEKLIKRRHPIQAAEVGKVLTTVGKLHEIKSGTSYYENTGMGGLFFAAYKVNCGIKEDDHFAVHIQKLIDAGNPVYMIKQDGDMVLGGTGPGVGKIIKTKQGRMAQRLLHPGVVLATGGLSAAIFGVAMAGWRGYYIYKNRPNAANAEAIVETLSTKLAQIRGFPSQEIDTIEGTYPDGSPKVCTIVGWTPGVRDLSGRLAGGDNFTNVVVALDPKHKKMIKVDANGNILRVSEADPTQYEKIDNENNIIEASQAEYEAALAVSDESIDGLGQSLLSFICMADRDGIGKEGQNKVIQPLREPRGNKKYQFFGIDFGKSYKGKNPIVDSLDDAFNFEQPSGQDAQFVNISILYDNPLRDKMKGLYLLAALRGVLTDDEKEEIAADYEQKGDALFANQLRAYPQQVDADLILIQDEEKKYRQLAADATTAEEREQFTAYANRVAEVYTLAKETDEKVLSVFAERLRLTPSQIDILDNLEKLTAKQATTLSPNGKVRLNHIRVEKQNRTPWQLESNADGTFTLVCKDNNPEAVKTKIEALQNHDRIGSLLQRANIVGGQLKIAGLDDADLQTLSEHLTEENVAIARDLEYRNETERDNFHQRLLDAQGRAAEPRTSEEEEEEPIPLLSVVDSPDEPHLTLTPEETFSEPQPRLTKSYTPLRHSVDESEDTVAPTSKKRAGYRLESQDSVAPAVKRVGFRLAPPGTDQQLPLEPQPILAQPGGSLKQVKAFLDSELAKPEASRISNVTHYTDVTLNENPGLLVTYKNRNIKTQALIEEDIDREELTYSADKNLKGEDFRIAAAEICRTAVFSAPLKGTIDLTHAPEDKKAILFELFSLEIEHAVVNGKFSNDTKPTIKGYTPEPSPAMTRLFTAARRT